MKKALLIADRNSVARAINSVYQKIRNTIPYDITITAAAGPLMDLCGPKEYDNTWEELSPKSKLPLFPEVWKTKVIPYASKYYNNIKALWDSGKYEMIINAGDPGSEGQLIQSYIYKSIGVNVPILRLWIDDLSFDSIQKGLENLKDNSEFIKMEHAAHLRAYFDWLVATNYTKAASLSLGRPVIIGSASTPTLTMVVSRQLSIQNFTPVNYYELKVQFRGAKGTYEGKMLNPNADESYPSPYAFANTDNLKTYMRLVGNSAFVSFVENEEVKEYAPRLFNLSDLQMEGSAKLGMSPTKVLDIAKTLYDKALISYPITTNRYINSDQKSKIVKIIDALNRDGVKFADRVTNADIERVFNQGNYTSDSNQALGNAIIPTGIKADVVAEEKQVYDLILRRFISIFMKPQTYWNQTITTCSGDMEFGSRGRKIIDLGYRELYPDNLDNALCDIEESETVYVERKDIIPNTTTPPKNYTYSSLIEDMDTADNLTDEETIQAAGSLGTPDKRGKIIDSLISCGYLTRDGKDIIPTGEGIELIMLLKNEDLVLPQNAREWDRKLQGIEKGTESEKSFSNTMISYVKSTTQKLLSLPKAGIYKAKIGKCPKCKENNFYELHSIYACEGRENKTCDLSFPKTIGGAMLTHEDVSLIIRGKASNVKTIRLNDGSKVKARLSLTPEYKIGLSKNIVGKCPVCGKNILEGKSGYYCEDFKTEPNEGCSFSVYGKVGNTTVVSYQAAQIFQYGRTKSAYKIVYKSGKEFTGYITCRKNEEDGNYWFTAVSEVGDICECPFCKSGRIREAKNVYTCSNRGECCDFCVPKKISKTLISYDDLKQLLDGGTVKKKIIFKNKTCANKTLRLIKDSEGNYKYTWSK